jgi:small subunit ribosomal protein S8
MDKVGNFFSALLNAQQRKKTSVYVSRTQMNKNLCQALQIEGFIENFVDNEENFQVFFARPFQIKRISTPGKRVYLGVRSINTPKRGLGILLLSTSKGIFSAHHAQMLHIGGEALCHIF